ncbi:PilZ domain-containing protein [Parasphingorhabdus sp.]|uniref:PilZ domain-containing protein n=1 Tax=Parasphingorhabdus sp. TaxID=2709688 RepID=UPI0032665BD3
MDKKNPRELRQRRLFKVEIVTDDGCEFDAIVRNISIFGLCMKATRKPRVGQLISIRKEKFKPISGMVRWVENDEFGVQLNEALSIEKFDFSDQNVEGQLIPKDETVGRRTQVGPSISYRRPGLFSRYKN